MSTVTLVPGKGSRLKCQLVPVAGLHIGGTYSVAFNVVAEGAWALHAELLDGTVLESAAPIHASYGPLTAAECLISLSSSTAGTVKCGAIYKCFVQAAEWELGELLPHCLRGPFCLASAHVLSDTFS